MSVTVYGPNGAGTTVAYTAPQGRAVTVETLAFTVDTDGTAGVHSVVVRFIDDASKRIVRLDDLNQAGPSQTNTYTYGLGLNASACTLPDGIAATDALPWTQIKDGATVTITAVDGTGTELTGDSIYGVVLQVNDPQVVAIQQQPLTELAGVGV